MFTPQEVSEKSFPKSSFGAGGYSMTAVDEFLDTLTEDYSSLYKENVALKAKLKVLAEKVEEYRATEEAMRSTLLAAQKMAAKLVQEAQSEKENLLADAHRQHEAALSQLEQEKLDAQKRLRLAQESLSDFICRSSELCRQQSEFLTTLPERELVPETPAQSSSPAPSPMEQHILDTISAITDEAESAEAAEELHAEPEPEDELPASDIAAIPSDFKLSLDELKFGRNYGGR